MPVERPLAGDALRFSLTEEAQRAADPDTLRRTGRSARTLLKDGPLRVTLIVLAAGGGIPEHHTEGHVTVQVLRGDLRIRFDGTDYDLAPGDLLAIGGGVPHSVASENGAEMLLTVGLEPPQRKDA